MAGDWMKVEKETPDKPEIYAIAELLQVDPDAVFGKCFRVWSWFDSHTTNGKSNGVCVSKLLVDRLVSVNGFADSMVSVGWLCADGDGVRANNFDIHNGETAKSRAMTAKRVAKHTNAKLTLDALPREEKRREENIKPKSTSRADALATRLPVDWVPSDVDQDFCASERPDLKADVVAERFRDYWISQPGAKGRKVDWAATWRNWVRNEKAFAKPAASWQDKRQAADEITSATIRNFGKQEMRVIGGGAA